MHLQASLKVFRLQVQVKLNVKQEPNTLYWMILMENAKIFTWAGHYKCKKNVHVWTNAPVCREKRKKSLLLNDLLSFQTKFFSKTQLYATDLCTLGIVGSAALD